MPKKKKQDAVQPKHGDLVVWHIPQLGMKGSFEVPVKTVAEAKVILDILARYDLFQLEHNIKPDYANVSGLKVFNEYSSDEPDWEDWEASDYRSIDELSLEECATAVWAGDNSRINKADIAEEVRLALLEQ